MEAGGSLNPVVFLHVEAEDNLHSLVRSQTPRRTTGWWVVSSRGRAIDCCGSLRPLLRFSRPKRIY